jgi:ribosomal-protein-alanine N-acetyltransferase
VIIRAAGIDDLDHIVRIERACFRVERYPRTVLKAMLTEEGFFTFLAEDPEVLGSATLLYRAGNLTAQLISIAVLPPHRNRGVAKTLLQKVEERARELGAERMVLQVSITNVPAINLYLHSGYFIKGVIKDYYGPKQDAYCMDKRLV